VEKLAPDKDKVARARPAAAAMERASKGRPEGMYLLDGAEYLGELVKELLLFPEGEHDDQVDAVSYGLVAKRKRRWGAA
jgi:predicted phage terminase large subunit-like protein